MSLVSKMRHPFARFVVFFATFVAFSPASLSFAGKNRVARCSSRLENLRPPELIELAQDFEKFEYVPANDGGGFSLELPEKLKPVGTRTVDIPPDQYDAEFLLKSVWKNIWEVDQKKYEFVSVGLKTLEAYSRRVNEEVLTHIFETADHNLTVTYDPMRTYIGNRMETHRWAYHDEVLRIYKDRKDYLTEERLKTLEKLNRISDNSDVFGILGYEEDSPSSFLNLSKSDIRRRLLVTIQLSYFGNRNFLWPTLRELFIAANTPYNNTMDLLPYEYGIPKEFRQDFRRKVYGRFDPLTSAEILRNSMFYRPGLPRKMRLPRPIYDALILNVFKTAKARGVKTLFVGCDDHTRKIFSRYNFLEFEPLPRLTPPKKGEMQEYLYYMIVGGPEFQEIVKILTERSQSVNKSWEPIP